MPLDLLWGAWDPWGAHCPTVGGQDPYPCLGGALLGVLHHTWGAQFLWGACALLGCTQEAGRALSHWRGLGPPVSHLHHPTRGAPHIAGDPTPTLCLPPAHLHTHGPCQRCPPREPRASPATGPAACPPARCPPGEPLTTPPTPPASPQPSPRPLLTCCRCRCTAWPCAPPAPTSLPWL